MAWLPSNVRLFKGKTAAPAVTDDINDGYQIGDVWLDETNNKSYQCLDNAVGAADWNQIDAVGGGGGDHGALTGLGDDDHSKYPTEAELASNANSLGASLIGIEDPTALYVATDVEVALAEVMDEITIVTHTADSFDETVGTSVGAVSDTQTINDGNELNIDETTGLPNPNFVFDFDFSGITSGHEPNLIELHYAYSGNHQINIEMWNYTGAPAWDVIDSAIIVNTGGTLVFEAIDISGVITDYTSGGAARIRFSHESNGVSTHDFEIDYLAIKDEHGVGSGITDHGALSGLADDDHTQYGLLTGARAFSEVRLTPKASSSGPEGTIFYDSDDDHVYVGTE